MGTNLRILSNNYLNANTTITTTSCPSSQYGNLYDRNPKTKVISVSASDATAEVFTFEFADAESVGAIYLNNHNLRTATIKYWNGSAYVNFSPAVSLSESTTTSNYWEFAAVSTLKVQISGTKTISANESKYITDLVIADMLLEPDTMPSDWQYEFAEQSIQNTMADGGNHYLYLGQKYQASITFTDISNGDLSSFNEIKQSGDSFFIYPCGGRTDIGNYGFRAQDIYLCNYTNSFKPQLKGGLFNVGSVCQIDLKEV